MDQKIIQTINKDKFVFDYRRAIFWPTRHLLIVTDLHWGKATFLQRYGIPVSEEIMDDDLQRLSALLNDYKAKTLLVLGDLIHHERSLTDMVVEKINIFRSANPCELILIKGNHDRYSIFPGSWGIIEEDFLSIDDFYFSHDFCTKTKSFQFFGHTHPTMRFSSGPDQLRLPVFIKGKKHCLLPAFSHLTGGESMKLKKGESAIAVLPDGLIKIDGH
jgi:uncharacterized protein